MKLRTWKEDGDWHAAADEPEPAGWEPGRLFRATLRTAPTKAAAQRLAREAYEDATAPRKLCRDPEHEGDPQLPATLRYFSRQGKRVRADGTPILRSRCRVCWAREQARLYLARKAKKSLDKSLDG